MNGQSMESGAAASRTRAGAIGGVLMGVVLSALAVLLYLVSRANYPLFHSIVDGVTVFIAGSVFLVVWTGRRRLDNGYYLVIAMAFLAFALLDFMHLVGNKGMGVLPQYGNLGPAFYIASRYVLGVSFLLAPLFIRRQVSALPLFAVYLLVVVLVLLSVLHWRNFPATYVEGTGLTAFKVYSDYAVCLMLLGGLGLLVLQRQAFEARVLKIIAFSLVLFIATGLAFTLYGDPFGITNAAGHLFQIASFYLVYLGFVETVLTKPQDILYRALRESEERLRLFVEHAPASLAMFDRQMRYLSVSRRWLRDYGLEERDIIGLSHYDVFSEIPERWREFHRRGLAGDVVGMDDDPFQRADGATQWLRWEIRPWRNAGGGVGGIVIFTEDVTARKQAEAALRESELKFRSFVEASAQIVWTVNAAAEVDMAIPSWQAFTGQSEQDARGMGWMNAIHADDRPRVAEAWRRAIDTGGIYEVEYRLRIHDGTWRQIQARGVPIKNADGTVKEYVGTCSDITARKAAEERLMTALHEKEVLLKEVHHRVKNNMQVLSSLVSLQSESLVSAYPSVEQKDGTGQPSQSSGERPDGPRSSSPSPGQSTMVHDESPMTLDPVVLQRLRGIFDDFRDQVRTMALVHENLYRSESLARIDFAEYANGLTAYLARAHEREGSTVRLTLDLEPVSLPIESAVPCGLILNELVTNAYKHAFRDRPAGEIVVRLRADSAGQVCLAVRDDGRGMPAGLDWRHAASLGLRLVQMLTRQIRGTVEAGRAAGGGTEFVLEFPQKVH
jgi:PAS domain S-box-containing protein